MTGRRREGQLLEALALLSALLPWAVCQAGPPVATPGINGPEIMLYIALPIGPSAPARSYGLRIDQHSLPSRLPASTANANDLSGRRELLNLRMAAHENLRIDIGRRVSWDFNRRQFNVPGGLPLMKPNLVRPMLAAGALPALALP